MSTETNFSDRPILYYIEGGYTNGIEQVFKEL